MVDRNRLFRFTWGIPVLVILFTGFAFSQVNLTFTVDMERAYNLGEFNPAEHQVDLRGSFTDWGDNPIEMIRLDETLMYTATVEFSDDYINQTVEFKFHGADWEPNPNRSYTITEDENQDVPVAIFGVPYILTVHFRVDMEAEVDEGNFDPDVDTLVVRGTFPRLIDPSLPEWDSSDFKLTHWEHSDYDYLYGISIQFPDAAVDSTIEFKFVIIPDVGDDIWEGIPDRSYVITADEHQDLPIVLFDQPYGDPVTAYITFSVDMSLMISFGFFKPEANDQVFVRGVFNSWSEEHPLFQDPDVEGWYDRTIEIEWVPGTLIEYKYYIKAGDGRDLEFTWEPFPGNREFEFTGDDIILERILWGGVGPDDFLEEPVPVTFRLDVSPALTGDDPLVGDFYIAGNVFPLFWIWDHPDRDRSHLRLHETDEENIYEVTITFPPGSVRDIYYKYGIETAPNSFIEESGFAEDRNLNIPPGTYSLEVFDGEWGDWEFNSVITNVEEVDSQIPLVYTLEQNYPNPFNPATVIRYSIPQTEQVVLRIYNMLGQEVATLVNEVQNPGTYQVTFDAMHLASGVYIYRLQAGEFVESRRMMLIK